MKVAFKRSPEDATYFSQIALITERCWGEDMKLDTAQKAWGGGRCHRSQLHLGMAVLRLCFAQTRDSHQPPGKAFNNGVAPHPWVGPPALLAADQRGHPEHRAPRGLCFTFRSLSKVPTLKCFVFPLQLLWVLLLNAFPFEFLLQEEFLPSKKKNCQHSLLGPLPRTSSIPRDHRGGWCWTQGPSSPPLGSSPVGSASSPIHPTGQDSGPSPSQQPSPPAGSALPISPLSTWGGGLQSSRATTSSSSWKIPEVPPSLSLFPKVRGTTHCSSWATAEESNWTTACWTAVLADSRYTWPSSCRRSRRLCWGSSCCQK